MADRKAFLDNGSPEFVNVCNHKAKKYEVRVAITMVLAFVTEQEYQDTIEDGDHDLASSYESGYILNKEIMEAVENDAFAKFLGSRVPGFSFTTEDPNLCSTVSVGDEEIAVTLRCSFPSTDGKQGGIPNAWVVMTKLIKLESMAFDLGDAFQEYQTAYKDIMEDQKLLEKSLTFVGAIKKTLLPVAIENADYLDRLLVLQEEVLQRVTNSLHRLDGASIKVQDWLAENLQVSDLFK